MTRYLGSGGRREAWTSTNERGTKQPVVIDDVSLGKTVFTTVGEILYEALPSICRRAN
jgi:hypothetical protein